MEQLEKFSHTIFTDYVANFYGYDSQVLQLENSSINVISFKKKKFKYAISLPFGLYSPLNSKEELSALMSEITREKADHVVINIGPDSGIDYEDLLHLTKEHKFKLIQRSCHIFESEENTPVVERFNSTRKKHIKRYIKAEKVNVHMTKDSRYFEEYFRLYEDSAKRWGTKTVYPKEFIADLWKVPGIYMWVAILDDKMISAMICMYHEDTVFDWLAASYLNDEYKSLYAAVAVQYEVFQHAQQNGCRHVNMGASEGLDGVSNYKNSWNAVQKTTHSLTKESLVFSILKRLHKFKSKFTRQHV
jgi:hypothetical protein